MNTTINEYDKRAIERLLTYMEENCTEPFDAKKHADMVCFSESKLNKVFKAFIGIGPATYYRNLRIQKALELHRNGIRNWTEVSHLIGYADLPTFSKAFKKIMGYSPNSFIA